jgi:hypothetical protein
MTNNARSLNVIADTILSLERGNVFEIGDLFIEAKAQCEHGEWLDWLRSEIDWSVDTAQRYMKVAEMTAKNRTLRHLNLAATTLYQLVREHHDDKFLPSIVAELAKHATKTKLRPADAGRVIKIGIGRCRFGDHPDATLVQLVEIDEFTGESWHEKAVAALQERRPETAEDASSIVDETEKLFRDIEREERRGNEEAAEQEADDILNCAPPALPPATTPPEPQRLGAETTWAETAPFVRAVTDLRNLRAKPVGRFVGQFSQAELREVGDFLTAVAAETGDADKAEAA